MTTLKVLPDMESQIGRELANAVRGEVRLHLHDRMLYATDASLYQVEPLGVVIPADLDDVAEAVRFCARRGLPILPRGGGTSLAGQCTNRAVVLDLSPNCRDVGDVDTAAGKVRAQAGVTLDDLNDGLLKRGGAAAEWFFAPDPATSRHATLGGCIGNNAAGARSVLYGRTSENVESIGVCLADGDRAEIGPGAALRHAGVREITRRVLRVVAEHAAEIRSRYPKTVRRNAGYGLDMVLMQMDRAGGDWSEPSDQMLGEINLAPLLCGSEGTLAVTLDATLLLRKRPKVKALAVAAYADLDEAIAAVPGLLATKPSAVEMLDDMIVGLAEANAEYRKYVELMPRPADGRPLKSILYVEYFAHSEEELSERLSAMARTLAAEGRGGGRNGLPGGVQVHREAAAQLAAWKLRKAGEPLLHGVPGSRKPITFIEDNAIPVERLGEFVKRLRAIVTRHGTIASYWAHASVGVLHVRPLLDIHDGADRERMRAIAVETADLARELGGVMSGEHGDGRVRGPLLERFFGRALMGAMAEVKRAFDPKNLLNPGNIIDLDGANPRPVESMAEHLRVEPEKGRPIALPGKLRTYFDYEDQHGFDGAVEMCNGAGVCRKKQGGVMCPSYMATLDERHSTRGRANALRLAISGQMEGGGGNSPWSDPGTMQTLDLCLSCKACKTECPSNVDVARLKAEYTAQRYAEKGSPLAARIMGNVRRLSALAGLTPGLANSVNSLAPVRALINAVLGLHPERSLVPFATPLPKLWKRGERGQAKQGAASVAFFGDCFSMYNEPHIGLAARRVMHAFGYEVRLTDAGCCARPKISLGLLEGAIEEIDAAVERLRPLVEDDGVKAILSPSRVVFRP